LAVDITLQFETAGSIVAGRGVAASAAERLKARDCRSAFLVTDAGVVAAGLAEALIGSLRDAGLGLTIFDEVTADPPETMVLDAVGRARAAGCDAVIGLGGGSPMDTAKLVAYLAVNPVDIASIYGVGLATGGRLPLILIPTTAGTGSEVTPIAIVTTPTSEKKGVVAKPLLPDVALLDASLTLGLPPAVTAATGIDAMVHAIEAYTSRNRKNPISDSLATRALKMLGDNLVRAVRQGADLEAREAMLMGSCLAGMAFANAPVAGVHALAYPLGGHFHVPHGLSNALVLPHVLRHNLSAAAPLYAELAAILLPQAAAGDNRSAAACFVDHLETLAEDTGVPRRLRQVGVAEEDIPILAEDAMKQTRLLVNNPAPITLEDAARIYRAAL
jgi:alcohol dehydrogenase class IV